MDVGNETLEFDSNPEHNNYKPWSDSEPYRYPCDGPAPKFEGYADPSFQSNQKQKKEEPLFVLDTSQNFQLDFEIQYEVYSLELNNYLIYITLLVYFFFGRLDRKKLFYILLINNPWFIYYSIYYVI